MGSDLFRKFVAPAVLAVAFCISAFAQQTPMNHFELASDARAKARALADGGKYEAALELLNSLETGRYERGDAAMQAAAAKVQGVHTDKARVLIRLGRYDEADAAFYRAFDANITEAEKSLAAIREHRPEASTSPEHLAKFRTASMAAKGSLELAEAVADLRESQYLVAGASGSAKPFDPARLAKHKTLSDTVEKASKLSR